MARPIAALMAAALAFLLAGCLGFPPARPAEPFAAPLYRRLIPDVPFIADNSSHCGPSTLAAVLTYHGRPTTKEEVAVDVQREDLRGALGPDMVIWARQHGFKAGFKSASPEEVIESIDRLKPVILLLDTGFGPIRKGHFVVAVGYGPDGLVVNTGDIQQELASWSPILTSWHKMGNFAIFIEGPDGSALPGSGGAAALPGGAALPEAGGLREGALPASSGPAPAQAPAASQGLVIQSAYPVPAGLIGADLPLDKPGSSEPIINFVGRPPREEPAVPAALAAPATAPVGAEAASGAAAEGGSEPGANAASEEAPLSAGITEESLAPPKVLPVVPLPEDDPLGPAAAAAAAEDAAKKAAAKAPSPSPESQAPAGPFQTGQILGNPRAAPAAAAASSNSPAAASAPAAAADSNAAPADSSGKAGSTQDNGPQALGNPSPSPDPGYAVITTSSGEVIGDPAESDEGYASITTSSGQRVGDRPADATPPGVVTLSPFLLESGGPQAAPPPGEAVPIMGWERGGQ
jgi:hypothetical protein